MTSKRPALLPMALSLLLSTPAAADSIRYFHLDGLGNVRVVTNQAGEVVERHDYFPFGEECVTGPCSGNTPIGAGQPRHLTGKERDKETGLDYFGARYYGSRIGRFTTVDPVYTWNDNLLDPQRWNRYSYVRNNPLRYSDPDGKIIVPVAIVLGGLFLLNNPTNTNVSDGPVNATIVPNSVIVAGGYGFTVGGTRLAVKEVFEEATGLPIGLPSTPFEPYDRLKHYGRTPTRADRRTFGVGADDVVNHDPPLVKRYYEGDPGCCEKPGSQMSPAERRESATDRSRMGRQSRTESNRQGAEMSRYSREKKKELTKE